MIGSPGQERNGLCSTMPQADLRTGRTDVHSEFDADSRGRRTDREVDRSGGRVQASDHQRSFLFRHFALKRNHTGGTAQDPRQALRGGHYVRIDEGSVREAASERPLP